MKIEYAKVNKEIGLFLGLIYVPFNNLGIFPKAGFYKVSDSPKKPFKKLNPNDNEPFKKYDESGKYYKYMGRNPYYLKYHQIDEVHQLLEIVNKVVYLSKDGVVYTYRFNFNISNNTFKSNFIISSVDTEYIKKLDLHHTTVCENLYMLIYNFCLYVRKGGFEKHYANF